MQLPLFGELIPNRIENLLLYGKGDWELNMICIFCRVASSIVLNLGKLLPARWFPKQQGRPSLCIKFSSVPSAALNSSDLVCQRKHQIADAIVCANPTFLCI